MYDLTNTYFESSKSKGEMARYGRSKYNRVDAKLIVPALVINREGFLKYLPFFMTAMMRIHLTECPPSIIGKTTNRATNPILDMNDGNTTVIFIAKDGGKSC